MSVHNTDKNHSQVSKTTLLYPFAIILLMLSAFNLTGNIFSFFVLFLRFNGVTFTEDTATLLSLGLNFIAEVGLILVFLFLWWRKKLEPEEKIVPKSKPLVFTYLVYFFESFFLFGILPLITAFLSTFEEVTSPYESFFPSVTLLSMPIYYILFFGVLSFGAAISEELAFRRALIPMLERRGLGTVWVLIISGLMFSLIHTPADLINGSWTFAIIHFCSTFMGGLALGFIYIRTRNVFYPILLHGFSNGVSGVLQIAYVQLEMGEAVLINLGLLWIGLTIFLGAVIVGYALFQLYQYRGYPHAPTWIQLLSDRKVIVTNLRILTLFTLIFVLIQGGVNILIDIIFSFFEVSLSTLFLEYAFESVILFGLIVISGFFIWKLASPLTTPTFVSEVKPFEKIPRYRPPQVQYSPLVCNSCGQEVSSQNQFCIYCGQKLERT